MGLPKGRTISMELGRYWMVYLQVLYRVAGSRTEGNKLEPRTQIILFSGT